jgi:hypothetical protein
MLFCFEVAKIVGVLKVILVFCFQYFDCGHLSNALFKLGWLEFNIGYKAKFCSKLSTYVFLLVFKNVYFSHCHSSYSFFFLLLSVHAFQTLNSLFTSPGESQPTKACFHPSKLLFSCGIFHFLFVRSYDCYFKIKISTYAFF